MKKQKDFKYFWEEGNKSTGKMSKNICHEPLELELSFHGIGMQQGLPVNVSETETSIVVEAHLPGFKKEDVNIQISGNSVEIYARKKSAKEQKGRGFYIQEAGSSSVSRSFKLPADVEADSAKAKLEDGVLVIKMSKARKGNRRNIGIK